VLSILSPAKTLDYETAPTTKKSTQPLFIDQAASLVKSARNMDPEDIQGLMGVSEKIATLNHERFMNWEPDFSLKNAKQSVLAFKGDVYTGLQAETLSADELAFAQKHLRILSGLYGLLRPLDLMQPYRLEMGRKFGVNGAKTLYEFWGAKLTDQLNADFESQSSKKNVLINLASNEYFNSIQTKGLDAEIITPVFKDWSNGKYRIVSFFAKKARGQMAAHIIKNRLKSPAKLKDFAVDGYRFDPEESTDNKLVFKRKQ
jgi:cytoplasmic iron level regulating protein YaaA (DUF328/UPF0246 family)